MLVQFILCCFKMILGESWYFMKHLQCYWGLNQGLENVNHPLCYGGYHPVLSTSERTESYFAHDCRGSRSRHHQDLFESGGGHMADGTTMS